eukprot:760945-Hanusia_phi.AAC.2
MTNLLMKPVDVLRDNMVENLHILKFLQSYMPRIPASHPKLLSSSQQSTYGLARARGCQPKKDLAQYLTLVRQGRNQDQ